MHKADTIQPQFSMRFADGTRMWVNTDSLVDILLHPVFLKYLGICVLIGAMSDRGGADIGTLIGQQAAMLWLLAGVGALLWFWFAFFILKHLSARGYITGAYSPIILFPVLVLAEFTTYHLASSFSAASLDMNLFLSDLFRDLVLLVLFDVLFSSYIVHHHPAFSKTPVAVMQPKGELPRISAIPAPTQLNAAEQLPIPKPQQAALPKSQAVQMQSERVVASADVSSPRASAVQIGGIVFSTEEILLLRSEDHYLTVVTASRKALVRARLSDTVAKLDLRYGVQINRSVWVAFAAIDRLRKTPKGLQIYMRDGSEETVATVRRHAVRSAFELYQMREQ